MTLDEAVSRLRAAGVDNPRLDARLLWAFAHQSRSTAAGAAAGEDQDRFTSLIARRAAREPLAYITGHKEFWSLDFDVGPGVLVPRPDTETLIEELARAYPDRSVPLAILDLGTGSGCLAIAALTLFPRARGTGIDASQEALSWARRNAARLGVADRLTLIQGDWPDGPAAGFDVILSNPPYIPTAAIDRLAPDVARHEPRLALDGGADGLAAYRVLAPRISRLLRPDGSAFLELGIGQSDDVSAIMMSAGLAMAKIVADLAGIPRCAVVKTRTDPI